VARLTHNSRLGTDCPDVAVELLRRPLPARAVPTVAGYNEMRPRCRGSRTRANISGVLLESWGQQGIASRHDDKTAGAWSPTAPASVDLLCTACQQAGPSTRRRVIAELRDRGRYQRNPPWRGNPRPPQWLRQRNCSPRWSTPRSDIPVTVFTDPDPWSRNTGRAAIPGHHRSGVRLVHRPRRAMP